MRNGRRLSITLVSMVLTMFLGMGISLAAEDSTGVEEPKYSMKPGFYGEDISVEIHANGSEIYYTLDGSLPKPEESGTYRYEDTLRLYADPKGKSRINCYVIRSVAVDSTGKQSAVSTATYFCGSGDAGFYTVPVVSLVTDPANLYDPTHGIFTNYWEKGQEWERPMQFAYFVDGREVVHMDVGARIHGGASRGSEVKSIRLYARTEYDEQNKFVYDFFEDAPIEATDVDGLSITEFKRLLLRNGGNEAATWDRSLYRDLLTQQAAKQVGIDVQAGRPVIVFLNGEFYGVLNLRERMDEKYIKEHYDVAEEDVAIYEFWYGSTGNFHVNVAVQVDQLYNKERDYYNEAYDYCTKYDMSLSVNYKKAQEYFDIENFIDYYCVQIYSGNEDWPGNNCKAWRYVGAKSAEPGKDGKIRWLMYDVEYAWSLYGASPERDSLAMLFDENKTEWPNPNGSTALFRSFMRNAEFRNRFVTRFLDMMNSNLSTEALTAFCDEMEELYGPIMKEYRDSTSQNFADLSHTAKQIREYVILREEMMEKHLDRVFATGELYTLSVAFDADCGTLYANTLEVTGSSLAYRDGHFYGEYSANYPVILRMEAKDGYRFVGWSGYMEIDNEELELEDLSSPKRVVLIAKLEREAEPTPEATLTPEITSTPVQKDEPVNTKDGKAIYVIVGALLVCAGAVIGMMFLSRKKASVSKGMQAEEKDESR